MIFYCLGCQLNKIEKYNKLTCDGNGGWLKIESSFRHPHLEFLNIIGANCGIILNINPEIILSVLILTLIGAEYLSFDRYYVSAYHVNMPYFSYHKDSGKRQTRARSGL